MGQTIFIITPVETAADIAPIPRAALLDLLYREGIIEPATESGPFPAGPNLRRHLGVTGCGITAADHPTFWAGPDLTVSCPSCTGEVTGSWLGNVTDISVVMHTQFACPECGARRQLPDYDIRDGALTSFALEIVTVTGELDTSTSFWAQMEDALGVKLRPVCIHL